MSLSVDFPDRSVERTPRAQIQKRPEIITSLGGGHGLFQTLTAARQCAPRTINAIVTVADDGGSSGRIRHELGQIPPGDLRMALAALTDDAADGELWEQLLQHRFGGHGALAGHALGNLMIVALTDILGSSQQALDHIAKLAGAQGRIIPVCVEPLDIEAEVSGLEEDPRVMRQVRGQVAVAATPGQVRRVRLIPDDPIANSDAVQAILDADLVTLGPGSWFSSVIPHVLVPEIREALAATTATKIVILNLTAEPGETAGFSTERHLHVLRQHAPNLKVDQFLVDAGTIASQSERRYIDRAAQTFGADVFFHDLRSEESRGRFASTHDPLKLSGALLDRYAEVQREKKGR